MPVRSWPLLLTLLLPSTAAGELSPLAVEIDGVEGVDGLAGAAWAEISPDGRHAVVAGSFETALAVFERAPGGELTFRQRIAGPPLQTVTGLAFSPGGEHLYTVAFNGDALGIFERDPSTGELSLLETVANGRGGVEHLVNPRGLTLSPAGDALFATSFGDDAVLSFRRDGDGGLTFVEAHVDGVDGVEGLARAHGVATSPDGEHLYVASPLDDALSVFRVLAGAALEFLEVVRDGTQGIEGLEEVQSVAVSPDGGLVATGGHPNAPGGDGWIVLFERDAATGALSFLDHLPNPASGSLGCTAGLSDPPARVRFSPDGRLLYATNAPHQAVAVVTVDRAAGQLRLTDLACVGEPGVSHLLGVSAVTLDPTGSNVYATATFDNAFVAFSACTLLFADGLETGDTSAWDLTQP